MSEATRHHIGDEIYCLNLENSPVKGTVRKILSTNGMVWLSIGVTDSLQDRYNPEDYLPMLIAASDCYKTLDELIDKQIENLKSQIHYWEEQRKALPR